MVSDRIDLLGGNDTYIALGGSDIVTRGLGDDFIHEVYGNGRDQIYGGAGRIH